MKRGRNILGAADCKRSVKRTKRIDEYETDGGVTIDGLLIKDGVVVGGGGAGDFFSSGAIPMAGDLDMGTNNLINAGTGAFSGDVTVGTVNSLPLKEDNTSSVYIGDSAGGSGTGTQNTVVGYNAGLSMGTGTQNTMIGYNAGQDVTSGNSNVVVGDESGYFQTTGSGNVIVGRRALRGALGLTTSEYNVAMGYEAAYSNTTGGYNVSVGNESAYSQTAGRYNVAVGDKAAYYQTEGENNIAIGSRALEGAIGATTSATNNNVAIGYHSAIGITTGYQNIAIGSNSGKAIDDGFRNICIGVTAECDPSSEYGISLGYAATSTMDHELVLGSGSNATGISYVVPGLTNNTDLGTDTLQFKDLHLAGSAFVNHTAGDEDDTVEIEGDLHVAHTSATAGDHGVEIDMDAAGFGDCKALDIVYTTGALAAQEEEEVIDMVIDATAATGGEVLGVAVNAVGATAAGVEAYALKAGVEVNVLKHEVGTFGDMDLAIRYYLGVENTVTSSFNTPGGSDLVFNADNDYIIIGDAAKFQATEWILNTPSSQNLRLDFFYLSTDDSPGPEVWTEFQPEDTTNGFRNTGTVSWLAADTVSPAWVADSADSYYKIKIVRTRNGTPSTLPLIDQVQISAAVEYGWDKNAAVTAASLNLTGDLDLGTNNLTNTGTGDFSGDVDVGGVLSVSDGTLANPAIVAASEPTTGFYFESQKIRAGIEGSPILELTRDTGGGVVRGMVKLGNNAGGGSGITGNYNIAIGANAGYDITSGGSNIAIGTNAMEQASGNVTGSDNICIGQGTEVFGAAGTNQIALGLDAVCTSDNQIMLGGPATDAACPGNLDVAGTLILSNGDADKILLKGASTKARITMATQWNLQHHAGDTATNNSGKYSWWSVNGSGTTTSRMTLGNTGNLTITGIGYQSTGTLWTATSDRKTKKNIIDADLDLCVDTMKAVRLRKYTYNEEFVAKYNVTDTSRLGFIAQEIMTLIPKAVKRHRDEKTEIKALVTARASHKAAKAATHEECKRCVVLEAAVAAAETDEEKELAVQALRLHEAKERDNLKAAVAVAKAELDLAIEEDAKEPLTDLNSTYSVNADTVLYSCFGAVQKLIGVVEAQAATIASLETRLAALEV